jgi:Tfp pilus assembly protein PilW
MTVRRRVRPSRPVGADGAAGFTMIELLITMTAGLLVVFATLGLFEAFNSGAARTHRLNDAQDRARQSVADVVSVLRDAGAPPPKTGATPLAVTRSNPNDLVFMSTAWPGESNTGSSTTHVERYCLDTSGTLWFDGFKAGTTGTNTPGASCPSTSTGWVHKPAAQRLANNTANPVFTYSATNPVRTVSINLRAEAGTAVASRPLALASSSALRGALAPQVDAGNIAQDPGPCQGGKALLTLDLSAGGASTNGATLSAAGAIGAGPGKILVNATSVAANVAITVTNAAGLQTLLIKSVSC